jgi:hypothetical protein
MRYYMRQEGLENPLERLPKEDRQRTIIAMFKVAKKLTTVCQERITPQVSFGSQAAEERSRC